MLKTCSAWSGASVTGSEETLTHKIHQTFVLEGRPSAKMSLMGPGKAWAGSGQAPADLQTPKLLWQEQAFDYLQGLLERQTAILIKSK